MRSIVSKEKGGRPVRPSGQYGAMNSTSADYGTTCSICVRNAGLRVCFTLRLRFKAACFMDSIFSGKTYINHTNERVMQSFLSVVPELSLLLWWLRSQGRALDISGSLHPTHAGAFA
jgi:hypothetical protein